MHLSKYNISVSDTLPFVDEYDFIDSQRNVLIGDLNNIVFVTFSYTVAKILSDKKISVLLINPINFDGIIYDPVFEDNIFERVIVYTNENTDYVKKMLAMNINTPNYVDINHFIQVMNISI